MLNDTTRAADSNAPTPPSAPPRASGLGRPFWLVWSAATVSFIGDGLMTGALPLLALSLTRDPRLIGALNAALIAGWILLGLVAGVVVDRSDRLRIMWRIDAARTVVMVALTAAVAAGALTMPALLGVAILLSLLAPFFGNASSSVLPELVPASSLQKANSWTQTPMLIATNLIGPPVGSLLFTGHHLAPFALNAISFLVSALLLHRLATTRRPRPAASQPAPAPSGTVTADHDETGQRTSPWRMLLDGLAYLAHHRSLRGLAIAVALINTLTGGTFAVLVLYVANDLHQPAGTYGWLVSAFAIGGAITGPLAPAITSRLGDRATIITAQACFCATAALLGAAPRFWVAAAALAVTGAASVLWNVTTISYRQRTVPPGMLGRVNSSYLVIGYAGIPVGSIAAGVLAQHLGTATTYVWGALAITILSLTLLPALLTVPNRHHSSDTDASPI